MPADVEAQPPASVASPSRPHFMLVPSLACPASCSYCFGPHRGPVMPQAMLASALDLMERVVAETGGDKVEVTFHGGEPLVAGHGFWRAALEGLRDRFEGSLKIGLQSNLWLLDDEYCRLFRSHHVHVGTSLDGPQAICDAQRGAGYFERTTAAIRLARTWGLDVGCIATFTADSVARWREVFDFFRQERLSFSIHAAVPPLERPDSPFALSAEEYSRLLRAMLDYYVEHRHDIPVGSLDQMCRSVAHGHGGVCTFQDCLGMFLAIDPHGDIFPCQRFSARSDMRLGSVLEQPSLAALLDSPMARRMRSWQETADDQCAGCDHQDQCRGGCPYNAWTTGRVTDPYCAAYRGTFEAIQTRLLEEMTSDQNLNAVAARPYDGKGHPLLRRGPYIDLTRDGPHPSNVARTARRIVAAVELARGPDDEAAGQRLVALGVCRTPESARASLARLRAQLHPTEHRLNNLYLHVTFGCQLHCTHCYAHASADGRGQPEMSVAHLVSLVQQAREAGFRQTIITGGEPLLHAGRATMLAELAAVRAAVAPMNLVLRSNLALPLTDTELRAVAEAFDQLVVSIDGGDAEHDARRGKGSYAATVANLERYQVVVAAGVPRAGELSLAAVLRSDDIVAEPGDAVRALAARLDVRRTRFRPILPLGRAERWQEPPTAEAIGAFREPSELIEEGFQPVSTCGLGQNLYVEPSGESFPCYAYHQPRSLLGNVIEHGLAIVLASDAFGLLCRHDVHTNLACRACEVRYLCGGACRAWGREVCQDDLDASPPACEGLQDRAWGLLGKAREYLGMKDERSA